MFPNRVSVVAGLMGALALIVGLTACSRDPDSGAAKPAAKGPQTSLSKLDAVAVPAPGAPDYFRASQHPLHFKPAIDTASDDQCLGCHAEVLEPSVRATSPAGVEARSVKAWYQRTSTYQGEQDTFHRRHRETAMAKALMNLSCNSCHQGHDPRDEAPNSSATGQNTGFTLRKQVDPEAICLRCHGALNWPVMGLPEPWEKSGQAFQGNCLVCHAAIRTNRHQVSYLKADAIESAAKQDPQVCHGCHGGRAWYRISYPYSRHAWPGMPEPAPDWAKDRPAHSEARFLIRAAR